MTQDHTQQDSRSRASKSSPALATGPGSVQLATPSAPPPSALTLLCLGASAWLTAVGWVVFVLDPSPRAKAASLLAGLPLLLGALAGRLPPGPTTQRAQSWLLLALYPAALAATLSAWPEADLERAHTPLSLSLAMLCLLSYGASALLAAQPARNTLVLQTVALHDEPQSKRTRRLWPTIVIACVLVGAFAIGVVAPLWPPFGGVEKAWGEAAPAGAVLSAVIASALSVSIVALFLGSALRLSDAEPRSKPSERRAQVAMLLFLSLLGGVVYYTISP